MGKLKKIKCKCGHDHLNRTSLLGGKIRHTYCQEEDCKCERFEKIRIINEGGKKDMGKKEERDQTTLIKNMVIVIIIGGVLLWWFGIIWS